MSIVRVFSRLSTDCWNKFQITNLVWLIGAQPATEVCIAPGKRFIPRGWDENLVLLYCQDAFISTHNLPHRLLELWKRRWGYVLLLGETNTLDPFKYLLLCQSKVAVVAVYTFLASAAVMATFALFLTNAEPNIDYCFLISWLRAFSLSPAVPSLIECSFSPYSMEPQIPLLS